mmetsp:Transcript_15038/g.32822  ORF Transcript_15038/g.32822 Transcript_15038/m.32822 type:complete len:435 (-) Transcript_15038:140-1444(-)|eukprot:CAMPEP_0172538638 /NCGR_PEP_ID=MMETSP1067-20121228/10001_1 /TAXON_ID=265564 ORGANISM="Thalassiosira punctigera, Strain Tpunct2005C2" /NCGR_SAMPLE_ID=MMETSP1067 /ASSEMBLY_ACC=CAM_ASM_000444 /LENGTH=434 /DNA_ID=CAMNT_0013324179 /DNA_START=47 /DNA_END=1351 /DNA_ORIENTATION=-
MIMPHHSCRKISIFFCIAIVVYVIRTRSNYVGGNDMEPKTLMIAESEELPPSHNLHTIIGDRRQLFGLASLDPKTVVARFPELSNSDGGSIPFYLEGGHQVAGLGHSFFSLHYLVSIAIKNNLLIRTAFAPGGSHHQARLASRGYFFDNLLMTEIPEGWECKNIQVSTSWRHPIQDDIKLAKEQLKQNPSDCVVFHIGVVKRRDKGLDLTLPYFRNLFEQNENGVRRSVIKRKWEDRPPHVINVAVHIRRGDLWHFLKLPRYRHEASWRFIEVSAYTSVLNQLFLYLAKYGRMDIHVQIYCEGMNPPAEVQSVTGKMIDLREGIVFDASVQTVTFLPGESDPIQAFDDMCHSNILITGGSSYSYLASFLCNTPVVLAMPGGPASYAIIPNAITLDVGRSEYKMAPPVDDIAALIDYAGFDETKFEMLWQERNTK